MKKKMFLDGERKKLMIGYNTQCQYEVKTLSCSCMGCGGCCAHLSNHPCLRVSVLHGGKINMCPSAL